jgi:hypothetical protein
MFSSYEKMPHDGTQDWCLPSSATKKPKLTCSHSLSSSFFTSPLHSQITQSQRAANPKNPIGRPSSQKMLKARGALRKKFTVGELIEFQQSTEVPSLSFPGANFVFICDGANVQGGKRTGILTVSFTFLFVN